MSQDSFKDRTAYVKNILKDREWKQGFDPKIDGLEETKYRVVFSVALQQSGLMDFDPSPEQLYELRQLFTKAAELDRPKYGKSPTLKQKMAMVDLDVHSWLKIENLAPDSDLFRQAYKRFVKIAMDNSKYPLPDFDRQDAAGQEQYVSLAESRQAKSFKHPNLRGQQQFELARQLATFEPLEEVVNDTLSTQDTARHYKLMEQLRVNLLQNDGMDDRKARDTVNQIAAMGNAHQKTLGGRF